MDTSQVEADLRLRIEQSAAWISDDPMPLDDLAVRNFQAQAIPVAFLDNPKRVEQFGVGFDLALVDAPRPVGVRLNVRLKPEAAVTEKGDSPPYVVIYVLNQESGAEEAIVWEHITRPDAYKDLVGLSIVEWYRNWLQYALVSKGVKKIFSPAMQRTD